MADRQKMVSYTEVELVKRLGPPTGRAAAPRRLGVVTTPDAFTEMMGGAKELEWRCPETDDTVPSDDRLCLALTLEPEAEKPRYYVTLLCEHHKNDFVMTPSRLVYGYNDPEPPRIVAMPTSEWESGKGADFDRFFELVHAGWQLASADSIENFPNYIFVVLTAPASEDRPNP